MLVELDEAECWELAASLPVGRVAWSTSTGPVVVPVNYVVHEQRVVLHASAYSTLAREADDSTVAFEVDEIDPLTRSGWSVLLRGRAHVVSLGETLPDVDTWPDGTRRLALVIDVDQVTGRRVLAS
jgi:nitroimidazol reductase NimA-like FMN-containing flavoprotein (pyridoxamine 5'-phosphate oxidase superfamily)